MTDPKDMTEQRRTFPIQSRRADGYPIRRLAALAIPWSVAEIAYAEYAAQGHGDQTLEDLARRGGFGREELLSLLHLSARRAAGTPERWRGPIYQGAD